jgi:hypothetical protein
MQQSGQQGETTVQLATVLPAVFGVVGVVVGVVLTAVLTFARESWFQSRKDLKDREYLAIQVSCQLERYVADCADVVADTGVYHEHPDEGGQRTERVKEPTFEPEQLKVEWKSLPTDFMYEILDFPSKAGHAKSMLEGAVEYSFPPDHNRWFEERQYQYAKLGVDASSLAARLRDLVGLSPRPASNEEWSPLEFMTKRLAEIDRRREARMKNQSRAFAIPATAPPSGSE